MSERGRGDRREELHTRQRLMMLLFISFPPLTRTAAAGLAARGAEHPVTERVAGSEITPTQLQSFKTLRQNGSLHDS